MFKLTRGRITTVSTILSGLFLLGGLAPAAHATQTASGPDALKIYCAEYARTREGSVQARSCVANYPGEIMFGGAIRNANGFRVPALVRAKLFRDGKVVASSQTSKTVNPHGSVEVTFSAGQQSGCHKFRSVITVQTAHGPSKEITSATVTICR